MERTKDYTHRPRGDGGIFGRCRVRLYEEPEETPVIVCSMLPGGGVSITNCCETVVAEVVLTVLPEAATTARKRRRFFRWVEHYPKEYLGEGVKELIHLAEFSDYRIRTGKKRRRVRDPEKALTVDARSR